MLSHSIFARDNIGPTYKYELGEDVTRTRIYIETMEEILPEMDKIILPGDEGSLLKLLNLDTAFEGGDGQ